MDLINWITWTAGDAWIRSHTDMCGDMVTFGTTGEDLLTLTVRLVKMLGLTSRKTPARQAEELLATATRQWRNHRSITKKDMRRLCTASGRLYRFSQNDCAEHVSAISIDGPLCWVLTVRHTVSPLRLVLCGQRHLLISFPRTMLHVSPWESQFKSTAGTAISIIKGILEIMSSTESVEKTTYWWITTLRSQ